MEKGKKVLVIQINPEWLYRKVVSNDGEDIKKERVRILWDFLNKKNRDKAKN